MTISERLNPPDDPPECYHGSYFPDCEECATRWMDDFDPSDDGDAAYDEAKDEGRL